MSISFPRKMRFTAATNSMKSSWPSWKERFCWLLPAAPAEAAETQTAPPYLVGVEGAKDDFREEQLLFSGLAVDSKELLELVQVQIPTRTLAGELTVKFLDVLRSHLFVCVGLRLTHVQMWSCRKATRKRQGHFCQAVRIPQPASSPADPAHFTFPNRTPVFWKLSSTLPVTASLPLKEATNTGSVTAKSS